MIVLVALYIAIGLVAAVDAGAYCREQMTRMPWWADAFAFVAIILLWLPIAAWALGGRESGR